MKYDSDYLINNKQFLPKSKYYVYALYLDNQKVPKYIGKGTGDRWRHYFYYPEKVANRILRKKLVELKNTGNTYKVEFLFESDSETECLDAESLFISYFGRVFNETGVLYNFNIDSQHSSKERRVNRKPIYVDGFVFDSVTRATDKTGIKRETLRKYCEIGRAAYLSDPKQVEKVFERERKLKYHFFYKRHARAIRRAKKCFLISEGRRGKDNWMYGKVTAIARKITVNGITYDSISLAAKEYGFSKGCSFKRHLERGNHNHEYTIH